MKAAGFLLFCLSLLTTEPAAAGVAADIRDGITVIISEASGDPITIPPPPPPIP